jgi:carboxylate-amine ligase
MTQRAAARIEVPTIGIEEELFVCDQTTRDVVALPDKVFAELNQVLGSNVSLEYKRGQVELRTGVHTSPTLLRDQHYALRFLLIDILDKHGLVPLACGTHPCADWRRMAAQPGDRYRWIERQKGDALHQLAVSGLHVHLGTFDSDRERLVRIPYYRPLIPILIAAAASSPMFDGRVTGALSWRRAIVSGLAPQTPPCFDTVAEYEDLLKSLRLLDIIRDDTDLWSDIRLGARGKPTVEIRSPDTTPCIDHSAAIAAFVQAFDLAFRMHMLETERGGGDADSFLAEMSARTAARDGANALVWDTRERMPIQIRDLAARLVHDVRPAAQILGTECWLDYFGMLFNQPTAAETLRHAAGVVDAPSAALNENAIPDLEAAIAWGLAASAEAPKVLWPPPELTSVVGAHLSAS